MKVNSNQITIVSISVIIILIIVIIIATIIGVSNNKMKDNNNNNNNNIRDDEEIKTNEKIDESTNSNSIAYFAGGCFWCMESDFEKLNGVIEVISGYTGGETINPSYEDVSSGSTGHFEAVKIIYDPSIISYETLLENYWINIDPVNPNGQFCDYGKQYSTAIFYTNDNEKKLAESSLAKVEEIIKEKVVTKILKLDIFYKAEDYHQNYHNTHPIKYKFYRSTCRRDKRLNQLWNNASLNLFDNQVYHIPSDEELKEKLTKLQYKVTKLDGTEPAFDNEYWNNTDEGIYVDIISGEPLFSSTDKFNSRTGWPSFTKPINNKFIVEKIDRKFFIKRTEVRSKYADSHLGHVFNDGPEPTNLRYCLNSASLRFVPKDDLKKEGYDEFLKLFE